MVLVEEEQTTPTEGGPSGPETRSIRGLVFAAIALLAIPSAIGLVMLRSDSVPTGPAFSDGNLLIQPADGSDLVAEDLLQPASATDDSGSRIQFIRSDDESVNIPNGGAIALDNGLRLEIFMAPYPPTSFAADVDFYVTDPNGDPVTDAAIFIEYDMFVMNHGPFLVEPEHIGGGHYLAPLRFTMFGPWEIKTATSAGGGSQSDATLSIYVWPA